MELQIMALKDIKPYKRNARKNDHAVGAVAESIRQCGYVAPIIVDEDCVILAGHTRWKALKQLGRDQCEVVVRPGLSEEQKRKYRLLDNKTAELAAWDMELLAAELDGLDFEGAEFDWGLSAAESAGSSEYQDFVDKFKPKKTTDDCYTPPNIYEAVRDYTVKKYNLEHCHVLRPFYPGGDYQSMVYPKDCVVIDNPPFSIISDICRWYQKRGIRFFLFAPGLVLFSIASGSCNYVLSGARITYENGATVNTSFVTNLGPWKIEVDPLLTKLVNVENDKNVKDPSKELSQYIYPDAVITGASYTLGQIGQSLKIPPEEAVFIRALDEQKSVHKGIYGGGFLLSYQAAAEHASAKRATAEPLEKIKWELSEREKNLIAGLGKKGGAIGE